jgi:hypothetical protein
LVDVVARLALPYSDEANQIRNAAHWAKSDAFDKRDAKKRGGPGVRKTKKAAKVAGIAVKRVEVVNLEAVSESVFRDLGGAKSQSSVEDELDARQRERLDCSAMPRKRMAPKDDSCWKPCLRAQT